VTDRAPARVTLRNQGTELLVVDADGSEHLFTAEYLRVQSPSAEVQGHGGVGGQLPYGKRAVKILKVRPVGHYAMGIDFDDGHDSGIFTWGYLRELSRDKVARWDKYIADLRSMGKGRDPDLQILRLQ
jgi:DUF971 family protein